MLGNRRGRDVSCRSGRNDVAVRSPSVRARHRSGSAQTAHAAQLKVKLRSTYSYRVHLEFYGQKYNHLWPGDGKVYVLKDSKYHTYNLWCCQGDQIRYGASFTIDDSVYWSVGRGEKHGCKGCCWTCGNRQTKAVTLRR